QGPTNFAFTKPLVAAITGRAIGGGLELALACDLRVAEEDSLLGLHPRKYCMPMMDMGAIRLPALIGLSRALDLTLTGRSLTASEALQFGLLNRVAKLGTAVGIAVQMVDTMCNLPGQAALRADRENLLQTYALRYDLEKVEFERALEALRSESHLGLKVYINELERPASRRK
ncbi:enoyl-CoA hydratase, partial [Clonorchis sinensis]